MPDPLTYHHHHHWPQIPQHLEAVAMTSKSPAPHHGDRYPPSPVSGVHTPSSKASAAPSNMERDIEHGDRPTNDSCDDDIARIASKRRTDDEAIAPFLARHIPTAYAPTGSKPVESSLKDPSTKFCYRHRPDLKCRRTADEPSMDNLQRELDTLPQADRQGISHVWSLFSAAPAKHRNLMLQGILTQCCFPQLSYLSTAVRDLIRIDFITALPSEIAFKVLCYLDTTSLCKAAQVSQRWRSLADDDVVWHKMCEQHIDRKCVKCGWGLPLLERKRLRDWKRQQQLRATGRGLNEWSPDLTPLPEASQEPVPPLELVLSPRKRAASSFSSDEGLSSPTQAKKQCTNGLTEFSDPHSGRTRFRPWKEVYKDRFKVGTNWKYGRCTTKIFKGHTNGVMCLQFDDNILATGSYDATIKIWDIETGAELRTLRGHTSGIRALQFDDTKLISGSLDRTLKVWNWRTGECMSTYQGHTEGIIALNFEGNILASGSVDKTVKIWNFEDKSTFSLKGHKDWVNAVKVDAASRTVFSASDDCTVRLWDLDTKQCIKVFEGHVGQVQQVLPLPADYEPEDDAAADGDDAGSSTASAAEYPAAALRAAYGEAFTSSSGRTRPLPPRYMLTGALDATVRLWDVSSGRCLRTFFGHVEGVWALAGDTLRVVSGAEDRMVKVWDARTGRCERTFAGHAGPVTCIGLSDSRMCTGSEDCEVRLYSFKAEEGEVHGVGVA